MPTLFSARDGRYTFAALDGTVDLIIDSLRTERYSLFGEIEVRCHLSGARDLRRPRHVVGDDPELSNAGARQSVTRLLAERARMNGIDWQGYLDDFTQRIRVAERTGSPSMPLHEIPRPPAEATIDLFGLSVLLNHPGASPAIRRDRS